jgi:4-amino-4-deoxy-L-arabinose transferase-like glycosyltransferase
MKFPWRGSADLHLAHLGLPLTLMIAALLRLWALGQGVPFAVQVDEPEVLLRAVRMMRTGDLNPHFYDYPTLYMYLQAVVAALRFLIGAMRGEWAALAQAPPEAFYVSARALTALFGTATVWIVYRVGVRWDARTGLLAAVMFAVMPLHVRESHFVLTDVPATFFVMLTLLLALRAHERATLSAFALAGAAAGLAAGTKYNGGLAILIPLVACLMTPASRPSRRVALAWIVAAAAIAFLVVAPYTVLDLPTFLNQFARLSGEYRTPRGGEPIWILYLKHLRIALDWGGSAIVIGGLILGLWRTVVGPDRPKWALLTLFPLVYFRFVSNQNIVFARYLLPMLPFLSLLAAAALVATLDAAQRRRVSPYLRHAGLVALLLVSMVPAAYTSVSFDARAARVWTTEQTYHWIMDNVPKGAHVVIETRVIVLPPGYHAVYVKQLASTTANQYASEGVQFLVASSERFGPSLYGTDRSSPLSDAYGQLFGETEELVRFGPTDDHPGPELRVLRVRQ